MAAPSDNRTPTRPRGFFSKLISGLLLLVGGLIFGLLLSIVIEWIGLSFIWTDEPDHASRMLATEIEYLNSDFRQTVVSSSPALVAQSVADALYYGLWQWTGIASLAMYLAQPVPAGASKAHRIAHRVYQTISDYVVAAAAITQLYGVRLAVAALSMPAFLFFGLVALVDGLVQRDLRKFGGGNESAWLYHRFKAILKPAAYVAIVLYLTLPISLHPSVIFVPAALLFAAAVSGTSATFKKTL